MQHLRPLFFFISSWLFCAPHTTAQTLAEELRYKPEQEQRWTRKIQDLTSLERHLYRNIFLPEPALDHLSTFLSSHINLESLNGYYRAAQNRIAPIEPALDSFIEEFDNLLHHLPKLEMTSYQCLLISTSLWHQLEVDSLMTETGFFFGTGSLHDAHKTQYTNKSKGMLRVMAKIDSEQGRMVDFIFNTQRAPIIWPHNSHFKVAEKYYNRQDNTYYLHLKDAPIQRPIPLVPPKQCSS